VVIGIRTALGEAAFSAWGWRIPFLISILLLAISLYIRLKLEESPVFREMKEAGEGSSKPLTEAFARWPNLKLVLIALLGAVAGQAVIWYAGQFYALFFLEKTLKVDGATANILIAIALALATPFFIFFGWLSDKVGRKKIIMAGCALAALTYFPLFGALTQAANPALARAQAESPVVVFAWQESCSFQFDPIGKAKFDRTGCDIAKSALAKAGIPYANEDGVYEPTAIVRIGDRTIHVAPGKDVSKELNGALTEAGYPAKAEPAAINKPLVVAILFILALYVTMVYGPIAALLVELFPTRIRYTSMSLPYHIGNGWFGGFLPTVAFAMVAATGDIYYGLWYPIGVAVVTLVVGMLFLPETFRRRLTD
jgi:MFS family permease